MSWQVTAVGIVVRLRTCNSYLESVQDDKGEKQTEWSQYPATGEGENSVGRCADEHPVDLQPQVDSLGSGPLRVQRRVREVYGGNHYIRDGGHHPDFSLETHQHGHHRWYDAGLGREQTHLVAGYLSNNRSNSDHDGNPVKTKIIIITHIIIILLPLESHNHNKYTGHLIMLLLYIILE